MEAGNYSDLANNVGLTTTYYAYLYVIINLLHNQQNLLLVGNSS